MDRHLLLDEDEINFLIETIRAWQQKEFDGDVFKSIFDTLINDENPEDMKKKIKENFDVALEKSKLCDERATLIKAKLIKMKQDLAIQKLGTQQKEKENESNAT